MGTYKEDEEEQTSRGLRETAQPFRWRPAPIRPRIRTPAPQVREWTVVFYPIGGGAPEEYVYGEEYRDLAELQFHYWQRAKEDPGRRREHRKVQLRMVVNNLSTVIDEIIFDE